MAQDINQAPDIHQALEILEKNLKDLESARTQVEKTIKTSNDLQQSVSEYAAAVKALVVSLGQMGSDWDNRGGKILDDFEKKVQDLSKDFSDKTEAEISKFKDQNEALSTSNEKLANIAAGLSGIQQSLESKLDDLYLATRDLQIDVAEQSGRINRNISDCQESIQRTRLSLEEKAENLLVEISALKDLFSAAEEKSKKASRINLIAIIVGVIVLVILHFV